ncbi:hypothetical protein BD769DRAFT_1393344 [Suillus cothurnatus]|nr:hypothetical protein BD769DRAFT_1393344 [Suillus cothurnatus]
MTTSFKEDEVDRLISGETWGLCTTESFGMLIMVMFREWTYQIYYLSSSGKPHASWLLYGSDGNVLSEIVDSKAQQYCLLKKNISMMCRKKGAGGKRKEMQGRREQRMYGYKTAYPATSLMVTERR